MSEQFIASVDQGTASSRCLVFDGRARVVSVSQIEHRHIFPRPGYVEHDAAEIWRNVQYVVQDALATVGLAVGDVVALGITNQRETTVLWDRATGVPVHNTLNWQDMRTDHLVRELGGDAGPTVSAIAAGSRSRPTSPVRRSAGCSTTSTASVSAPRTARCCSGRSTPG